MKIKHIIAPVLIFSLATIGIMGNTYSDDSYNMVEKQQFALSYFKALGKQEDTVISPLLAMITIGELSGIVDDSVRDRSLALLDSKKDISALNITCGRLLSKLKISDLNHSNFVATYNYNTNTGGGDGDTSSNFDYSSNFLIKLEDIEGVEGFNSAYTSNLSNLYRGRINYYTKEQYNTLIEEIDNSGEFREWYQYPELETDITLFNKLAYKNNLQCIDAKALVPCNIETIDNKVVKGVKSRDIISCTKSNSSLSCKISSGDTSVSLVLMMPTDENISLDEYIDNIALDEFRELLYGYQYEPWCKDTDGDIDTDADTNVDIDNFNCVFPEITDYSIIKDNSTYDKMGLGDLFNTELKLEGTQDDTKLRSIIQYTGIEIKAPSESNISNDYNNETKTMVFNRPFVYVLIEDETKYPLIIGRLDNI